MKYKIDTIVKNVFNMFGKYISEEELFDLLKDVDLKDYNEIKKRSMYITTFIKRKDRYIVSHSNILNLISNALGYKSNKKMKEDLYGLNLKFKIINERYYCKD